MKKRIIICISFLCIMTISGCQKDYSDKMQLAENYLNDELAMDCTVVDCDFQQYSYGATGGMFIYSFECRGKDSEFTANYIYITDLTDETVSKLTVDMEG